MGVIISITRILKILKYDFQGEFNFSLIKISRGLNVGSSGADFGDFGGESSIVAPTRHLIGKVLVVNSLYES